ncbi:SREC-like protein, partial [Mya arenaria]
MSLDDCVWSVNTGQALNSYIYGMLHNVMPLQMDYFRLAHSVSICVTVPETRSVMMSLARATKDVMDVGLDLLVSIVSEGNDGNPNTCSYTNFESAANDRQIPPYWMIFFQKDVNLSKIELQTLPSAIYRGYYEGFKIYIENFPSDKLSYTSSDRNYVPPAEDRLLCYQHDGFDTPSAEMAVNCGRSLPGNSARIEMRNKSTQLVLCDIKINVGRNFAFGKPTFYSFDNEQTSKPGLAVDGATATHSQCIFVTTSDPWWEVDLGTILQVNRIVISEYNREYLSGYIVETAQVPGGNRTTVFTDDSECPYMRWGDLCENNCGHCLDDYCYDWNGYCKNGCESGYKTTDMCFDECEDGRFGKGCFDTCGHCLDGLACNKMTGYCDQGCAPGWTALPTCKQECEGDTYGLMCHKSCSHKCEGGCNKVDGACNGCVDGWKRKFCDEKEEQSFTASEVAGLAGGTVGGCLLLLGL